MPRCSARAPICSCSCCPASRWGCCSAAANACWGYALAGLPLLLFVALRHAAIHPLVALTDRQYAAMRSLDDVSVATLTWFMMAMFGTMTSALARTDR